MKTILVATDFSDQSRKALLFVLELLKMSSEPCHVELLNTYVVLQDDPSTAISINDSLRGLSREGLATNVLEATTLAAGAPITFEIVSKMGSLQNVIAQMLKKKNYAFIAMGKDGGRHVEEVASYLNTNAGCPLIITFGKAPK